MLIRLSLVCFLFLALTACSFDRAYDDETERLLKPPLLHLTPTIEPAHESDKTL